jgi:hypothetical protein
MPSDAALLARIRGEYREMPGLRLTIAQACRLFQLDMPTCVPLLEQLAAEGTLARQVDGTYCARSAMRPRPARAALSNATYATTRRRA